MIEYKEIGPLLNLRFNTQAAHYISQSPPHSDKICLRNFFVRLIREPVRVPCASIGNAMLIAACGHIIILKNNGTRVHRIEPGVLDKSSS